MSAKPILYGFENSPPVRACLLAAKAINLDFEFKQVNFMNGDHQTEEYLKKNPQHTVPLLEDDGHCIWDSHAIIPYLVQKYGEEKHQALYPSDFFTRAMVDQRLHFDSGILFPKIRAIAILLFRRNITDVPEEMLTDIFGAYDFVEKFLATDKYMVGNSLTVADFCCIASITSLQFVPIDSAKYPKLCEWIKRMKQLPYYEDANGNVARQLVDIIKSKLNETKNK